MSESYNDPSNRYDQAYMQEGVYEYHETKFTVSKMVLTTNSHDQSPFKPPPPSEATSSYITAPVRRTFIQRNKWKVLRDLATTLPESLRRYGEP